MIGLSALALVAGGGAAIAHDHGMKADTDGNAMVSRAEAEAHAVAKFAKMDANNDGALTPADHEARMAAHRAEMFAMIDADKNGQISREEFMAHRHGGMPGGMERGHHKMGMGGHGHGGMMMAMADANKDGSVSKAEFTAAALGRFDKADANKDGQVSAEERNAQREQMHEQMRGRMQDMKHDHSAT